MTVPVREALEDILRGDLSIGATQISRSSRLVGDLGLDSLAFAIGVVAIEERLGVALTERELLSCNTVGDLEDVISAKRGGASAEAGNLVSPGE